ncbi:MAG: hypothetical protein E4G90_04185 [Gemmatimonadales bacterium]|nr:MAG: hypothetical protein E4G90_04185 [Gemmatimonadales bacterium]
MSQSGWLRVALRGMVVAACGTSVAMGAADFSRYEVILSRKPFGDLNAVVPGSNVVLAAESYIVKNLKLVAITETSDGIKAGIVDVGAGSKCSYLGVGESNEEGVTLVDADYETEAALLRKDGEERWVTMGGGSPAGAAPASVGGGTAAGGTALMTPEEQLTFAEKLKRRREKVRVKTISAPEFSQGVDSQEHFKELQMELIRKGGEEGAPLPMELTPEMDAQLVSEGVLPPAEPQE